MAKNVLFFIIDSVTAEHLDETPYRHTPMPLITTFTTVFGSFGWAKIRGLWERRKSALI